MSGFEKGLKIFETSRKNVSGQTYVLPEPGLISVEKTITSRHKIYIPFFVFL